MKKLLSLVLVLCMVFGMSVSVFAASASDLVPAKEEGVDSITIEIDGEVEWSGALNLKGHKNVTFVGKTGAATDVIKFTGLGYNNAMVAGASGLGGYSVTFKNVTLDKTACTENYIGFHHSSAETYENCIIKGEWWTYAGTATFNGCTFEQESADKYNIWTYGAAEANFNDCTFNSAGKSVLIYNEQGKDDQKEVNFDDCEFNASQKVEGKAAIEIGTGSTFTVNIDECTAEGFDNGSKSGNPLWNMKADETTGDLNGNYSGTSTNSVVNAGVQTPNTDPTVPVVTPEPEIPVAKEETYKSVVSASMENGSVKVDSKKVTRGEKVTIIVTPDKGYELAALSVIDEDGNERKVTENEDGTFSFRMPEGGVTIEAEFAKIGASTSAPSTEKENPSTGASDFVGAAAALAVVSVMGMAALSIKR